MFSPSRDRRVTCPTLTHHGSSEIIDSVVCWPRLPVEAGRSICSLHRPLRLETSSRAATADGNLVGRIWRLAPTGLNYMIGQGGRNTDWSNIRLAKRSGTSSTRGPLSMEKRLGTVGGTVNPSGEAVSLRSRSRVSSHNMVGTPKSCMRMPTHKQATATAVPMLAIWTWARTFMPNTCRTTASISLSKNPRRSRSSCRLGILRTLWSSRWDRNFRRQIAP